MAWKYLRDASMSSFRLLLWDSARHTEDKNKTEKSPKLQ